MSLAPFLAPADLKRTPADYSNVVPIRFHRMPLLIGENSADVVFIDSRLGTGTYGCVFAGTRLCDNLPVAAKMEPIDNDEMTRLLEVEAALLSQITLQQLYDLAPRMYGCGVMACLRPEEACTSHRNPYAPYRLTGVPTMTRHQAREARRLQQSVTSADLGFMYIVIERMDATLEEHMLKLPTSTPSARPKFTVAGTFMLAFHLLSKMKQLHDLGYLHRDLKPENVMTKRENGETTIRLVDFGLARCMYEQDDETGEFLRDAETGRPIFIPQNRRTVKAGTPFFQSVAAHQVKRQSRGNELESLFYLILYFLQGTLPWAQYENWNMALKRANERDWHNQACRKIMEDKVALSTGRRSTLAARGVPAALIAILDEATRCGYEDRPAYERLQDTLMFELRGMGLDPMSSKFDWELTRREYMDRSSSTSSTSSSSTTAAAAVAAAAAAAAAATSTS